MSEIEYNKSPLRVFKVNPRLKPYLNRVFIRDCIPYRFLNNKGVDYVQVPLSGKQFHYIVEDALCEAERGEAWNVPVYSLNTFLNTKKLKRLCKANHTNGFKIWSHDKEKYIKQVEGHRY